MAAEDFGFIQCPHCGRELLEGRDYTGKLTVCPACRKPVPPPMPVMPVPSFDAPQYPTVDLSRLVLDPRILAMIPAALAREKRVLPLAMEEGVLTVVMAAPPPPELLDSLRFLVNHPIAVALTAPQALASALDQCYPGGETKAEPKAEPKADVRLEGKTGLSGIGYSKPKPWLNLEAPPSPFEKMLEPDHEAVLRTVQTLLREAFQWGASRLLLLPHKGRVKVGYRIQNTVVVRDDLPPEMLYAILCTLVTMTDLSGFIKVSIAKQERQIHLTFAALSEGVSVLADLGEDSTAKEASRQRAARLGFPFVDLEEVGIPWAVLERVPARVARTHRVLPVAFDGEKVTLAMAAPRDPDKLDQLRFALNRPIVVVLAAEGAIMAAVERYYGSVDAEIAELMREQLTPKPSAVSEAEPAAADSPTVVGSVPAAAHPVVLALREYLGTAYREPMFAWFDAVRSGAPLCQAEAASGDLTVIFHHAPIIQHMPAEAQRYVDKKIWVFRAAIIARLQQFLESDPLARGLAASYALYLASCEWAEGTRTSINPACREEAWINCLYALLTRSFPTLTTNGALAKFLAEHREQLSAKVAELLADPERVVAPAAVAAWLTRLEGQTSFDEPIEGRSPRMVHLEGLLVAEAMRGRATQVALLPQDDAIEVAYRVQTAVYGRPSLPRHLWFPLLDRLAGQTDAEGRCELAVEGKSRQARLHLVCGETGLSARLEVLPDPAALAACQDEAMISGHRLVELAQVEVAAGLVASVPKAVLWKRRILPLGLQGQQVTVAMSTPPTPRRMAELKLLFRRPVVVVLAPEDALMAALYRHLHPAAAGPACSPAAAALLGCE